MLILLIYPSPLFLGGLRALLDYAKDNRESAEAQCYVNSAMATMSAVGSVRWVIELGGMDACLLFLYI